MKTTLRSFSSALLLAWVALLPLQTRWFLHRGFLGGGVWEYGTLSLYVTDLLLFAALVLFCLADPQKFFRRPVWLPRGVVTGAFVLLLATQLSVWTAIDPGVALGWWVRFVLYFLAWWLLVVSAMPIRWIAIALGAAASAEGLFALSQFAFQTIPANTLFGIASHAPVIAGDAVVETVAGRFLRAYATLPHPNIAGGFFAVALVLLSGLYLRLADRYERALVLIGFVLTETGLLLTFSRSALITWFAAFLSLVLLALVQEGKEARQHPWWHFGFRHRQSFPGFAMVRLVVVSLVLFGAFLPIVGPLLSARTDSTNRLEQRSITERTDSIKEVQTLVRTYPLLGVGVANYTNAVKNEISDGRASWAYQPVHSVPLLILAEIGVLGSIVAVAGVVLAVVSAIRGRTRKKTRGVSPQWTFLVLPLAVTIVLLSLFDHYLWSLPFGLGLTAVVFAVLVRTLDPEASDDQER